MKKGEIMQGQTDPRGAPLSTADPENVAALERAHAMALGFEGDPIAEIDAALERAPDFVMGWIFKAAMLTQAMETRVYHPMKQALERAEALADRANERERGHMAAVRAWVDGDFSRACAEWDRVLVDHPRDLLALQLAHLSDVLLGDTVNQRDRIARVLPEWHEGVPGYGWVLGFYAFGLEENRDFGRAEEMGRRAVALNPKDAYAIHAVAHVHEMTGRQEGGIWWMTSRREDWAHGNFANHLWWHLSLFHLDIGEIDRVFEIYDRHLRGGPGAENKYQELDSAALLWRLQLYGEAVGPRWSELSEKWAPSATDSLYAFNDVHAMMTFVADGRDDLAEEVLTAAERHVLRGADDNVAMTREVGLPFCRALQAFAKGDYDEAVDRLLPIRYGTHKLGGSHAQRDVIALTLIEAALRAGRSALARTLLNERIALKPTSPQNWRMLARARDGAGDGVGARKARARAASRFSSFGEEGGATGSL